MPSPDFSDLPPWLRAFLVSLVADAVRPAVAEALVEALPEVIRRASLPPYLTRQQVLDLTGWSCRKLSYHQSEQLLPVVKRGRTVLFRAADVEAFLMEGYVPAKASKKRGA